ncbi:sigma-70 family RNA polymerase sigma factor [Brevundimonas sp.]|uniref:sigma-70 family RNA polymerase sigma factor n=1 Tax=Brevundimonas sp. TaxID=1871086 RepID=UPI0025E83598|nr:sigma-70 family RNA polymerase sigma factor [Brevundimonas sp.]
MMDPGQGLSLPTEEARGTTDIEEWRESLVEMIPSLRAFAWSLSRDGSQADDLVQDTLIKAWTNREKFQAGTNLRAWLFTILRNTYYSAAIRKRREVQDTDGVMAGRLTTEASQDWRVAFTDLREALAKLPDEHREALILVGAAGLSYEEAADICGCALGTIKSRVNRARTKLLALLEAEDAAAAMPDPRFA